MFYKKKKDVKNTIFEKFPKYGFFKNMHQKSCV